jgi:hypothetical protein
MSVWSILSLDSAFWSSAPPRVCCLHLLRSVDTLLAVRSIYYLRADLADVFDAVGRHVPNAVLCGNKNRARKYAEAQGNPDDPLGKFNYFATLDDLAPARLRLRSPPSTDQAHRLPIERLTCRR